MHLIGAVLLIAAGGLWGTERVSRQRRLVRTLADILASLDALRGEVCTLLTSLPEAAARLADTAPALAKPLYAAFAAGLDELACCGAPALWSRAVRFALPDGEHISALENLGSALGRYDTAVQQAAFERTAVQLADCLSRAEAQARSAARLWPGLGAAGGCLLALLFL